MSPPSLDGQTVWSNTAPVTFYSYAPFALSGRLAAMRARMAASFGVAWPASAALRARPPILVGPFGQTMAASAALRARSAMFIGSLGQTMSASAALRARAPAIVGACGQTMAASAALRARRASASGSARPWQPTDLSNLLVWLRADTGVSLSGSSVSRWADQSGHGKDLVQATSANQPAYSATALGGKPGINFTAASNTCLQTASALAYGASSVVTVYAVFAMTIASVAAFYESGDGSTTNQVFAVLPATASAGAFTGYSLNGFASNYTYDYFVPGSPIASPCQMSAVHNIGLGNVQRCSVRFNRSAQTMTHGSNGSPSASTFSDRVLNVGARNGGTALGVTMTLSELAVCNGAPGASDQAAFESYAKSFWSLP